VNTWDEAAAAAVSKIVKFFTPNPDGPSLQHVRELLNEIISTIMNNDLVRYSPRALCLDWQNLGFLALAAGAGAGVLPAAGPREVELFEQHLLATLVKKQTDYGHDNIARFGSTGLAVRVHDKVARLENLAARGVPPENESLFDNYMDVIGYSAIGMMWEKDQFMLPLEKNLKIQEF
jgi:hypothetical protein